jgi:F0F1-type ATP synthase membrane subunit b/b'
MDNILGNRRKVIEEDLVGAEKLRETAQELKNSITEEVDLARLRAAEIIGKSKEKIKETRNKGLAEAAEITSALLEESEKAIQKMQKDADKQIRRLSEDLAPEIVTKLSTQD